MPICEVKAETEQTTHSNARNNHSAVHGIPYLQKTDRRLKLRVVQTHQHRPTSIFIEFQFAEVDLVEHQCVGNGVKRGQERGQEPHVRVFVQFPRSPSATHPPYDRQARESLQYARVRRTHTQAHVNASKYNVKNCN